MASSTAVAGRPEADRRTHSTPHHTTHTPPHCASHSTSHSITRSTAHSPTRLGPSTWGGATPVPGAGMASPEAFPARGTVGISSGQRGYPTEAGTGAGAGAGAGAGTGSGAVSHGCPSPVKVWSARGRVDPAQLMPGFAATDTTGRTKFSPLRNSDRRSLDLMDIIQGALGRVEVSQLVPGMAPAARGIRGRLEGCTEGVSAAGRGAATDAANCGRRDGQRGKSPRSTKASPRHTAANTPGATPGDTRGGRWQEVRGGSAAAVKGVFTKGCRLQGRGWGVAEGSEGRTAGERGHREGGGDGGRGGMQGVVEEEGGENEGGSESDSESEDEEEDDEGFVFRVPSARARAQAQPRDQAAARRSATETPTSATVTPRSATVTHSSPAVAPSSATGTPRLGTVTPRGITVTPREDNSDTDDEELFRFSPRSSGVLSSRSQLSPSASSLASHPTSLAHSASLAPRSASLAYQQGSMSQPPASERALRTYPSSPPTVPAASSAPRVHPTKGLPPSPTAPGASPADMAGADVAHSPAEVAGVAPAACRVFSLAELASATDSWHPSRVVGKGSYGTVYRGRIGGQEVAIKRLDSLGRQGPREYFTELQVLSKFRHSNIVGLLGGCPEGHCLVFEFVSGGSLQECIVRESERRREGQGGKGDARGDERGSGRGRSEGERGHASGDVTGGVRGHMSGDMSGGVSGAVIGGVSEAGRGILQWPEKARILAGLASALVALHQSDPPVVHRDLKPQNVLLSYSTTTSTTGNSKGPNTTSNSVSNGASSGGPIAGGATAGDVPASGAVRAGATVIDAKLADVGMARLMENEADANMTYTVSGTIGYIDPESMRDYSVSPMADVYGFGLIGLQLLLAEPRVLSVHRMLEALPEGSMREGPYPSPFAVQRVGQLVADVDPSCPCHVAEVLALLLLKCLQRRRVYRPDLAADTLPTLQKLSAWGSGQILSQGEDQGHSQEKQGCGVGGASPQQNHRAARESSVRARHVRGPCSLPVNLLPQPKPQPVRSTSLRQGR